MADILHDSRHESASGARSERARVALRAGLLTLLLLVPGATAAAEGAAAAPMGAAAAPDGSSESWLARAQRSIAEREYHASRNRLGLQAPNRAHGLRTYFEPTGIRVEDRTRPGSQTLLSLAVAGVGRGEMLAAVAPGEIASEGGRVESRHRGLLEWYENSPAGLEQGFTFEERPVGSGPLAIELRVGVASPSLQGDDVSFATPGGRRLRYGALRARDASGRALVAQIALAGPDRLRLEVDDAGAVYPVVLDPLLTGLWDTTLVSDQSGSEFGFDVAGAGDVNGDGYADVIVGAQFYDAGQPGEGAAFVFLGGAGGVADGGPATAAAQLVSSQAYAALGSSVAGAGDVNGDGYDDVIVGAYRYDAGQPLEGAAFVFLGSASGIADGNPSRAAAQLESDQSASEFGFAVAGAGDVNGDGYADVIVGAHFYSAGQASEGAAFVFLGGAGGVASGSPATAAAQLESNQAGAALGVSVAGAGDVNGDGYADVVVGANLYDAGQSNEGAAFVFLGSAAGIAGSDPSTASAQLESDQADANLGISVAGAGDVNGDGYADVLVGADFYDAGQSDEGAAFVFLGSAAGVPSGSPATASAQLESDQADARFGASVAGTGDVNGDGYADVVVGAPLYEEYETDEGAALVFLGSAAGVASGNPAMATAVLVSSQSGAGFGASVAGAGDVNGDGYADVLVGAPSEGTGSQGAAFVFLGAAHGLADGGPATAASQLESDQSDARLGFSVAGAGDVNGDGYDDVLVGAPFYDAGELLEGAAFVFLGSAAGIVGGDPTTAAAQLESDQVNAGFGAGVAGAGDVNGDGYADVIVGAYLYDAGETDDGAAFVFLGSAAGIVGGDPTTAAAQLESDQANAEFGASVAGAGDVNGDGYADVLVGAPEYDAAQTDEGAVFVFLGSAAGIASGGPATAAVQLESGQAGAYLGISVAGAGDVNGDGYADIVVGASDYDAGETDEGAAAVLLGSAAGITTANAASLESDQAYAWFGESVAGAGDVNGDGYADILVGAPRYDSGQTDEGAAFLFLGSTAGIASGSAATAAAQIESDQTSAWLGTVAGAGDVNGDGYADVLVGAYQYDAGQIDEGAAFLFLGSAAGIASGNPAAASAQLESDQAYALFGASVAGAGDVNGDGYADVVVGAYDYDAGQNNEGAAFVFLGNAEGRPLRAQQQRGDASQVAVAPWGTSHAAGAFEVELTATHPEGRGRVKLEVEACPTGVAFGDASCTTQQGASWTDVTATPGGVRLSEAVTGLADDALYRWHARVLYAPYSVTEPGITPAPHPAHGPWRRVSAQADEADIRTVPEPGQVVLLLAGLVALRLLPRRRMPG